MKRSALITGITGVIAATLVAAAWAPTARYLAWRRDYAEAEPLVKVVWPMAGEMKRYFETTGRLPTNLDQLEAFSADYDFSPLYAYPHTFTTDRTTLFRLRVNSRFSFEIDKSFTPNWADFTGVFDKTASDQEASLDPSASRTPGMAFSSRSLTFR